MSILTLLLLAVAALLIVVSTAWMIYLGFQRHWAWGVGLLVPLLPVAALCFLPLDMLVRLTLLLGVVALAGLAILITFVAKEWHEANRPLGWLLASLPLIGMALFSLPFSGAPSLGKVGAALQLQGVSPGLIDRLHLVVPATAGGEPAASAQRRPRQGGPVPQPVSSFRSRLPAPRGAPGQPEPAAPGTFYLLERVTATTASGFHAANPGEKVILLERMAGNRLRVTVGNADFVVRGTQVTDDLNLAREAEREDFVLRGGRL